MPALLSARQDLDEARELLSYWEARARSLTILAAVAAIDLLRLLFS